jgi:hypothetical protein
MTDSAFKDILELKKSLQEKIRNEGKEILKVELNKFLEKHQDVHTLLWAQSDNVYNDEGYEFQVFGFDLLVQTDLPYAKDFYKLLEEEYGGRNKEVQDKEHFHGETLYTLGTCADNFPEHREAINSIKNDLRKLQASIPEEVFQVFGNVAVRVTREGIFMADYESDY